MAEPRRMDRRQQQLEELSAASIRALANDPRLTWRRQVLYRDDVPIPAHAPHLRVPDTGRDLHVLRGLGDAHALRLQYSDHALFRQTCPQQPVERLVFELLEQLRVETCVPPEMPGMLVNVHERFRAWSRGFHESGLTDTSLGILLYTLAQMVWSRLNAIPVIPETEDFIEVTRAGLAPVVGHDLAGLRRFRHDQRKFSVYARQLARAVAATITAANKGDEESEDMVREVDNAFALLLDFDDPEADLPASVPSGDSRVFQQSGGVYRIFTTQFDREVDAATEVRAALLRDYRTELDTLVAEQRVNRSRLIRLLRAALALPQYDGRSDGEEEGRIDGRRLAHLVSSPMERRLFTRERAVLRADCGVTFLVDCSGSMKHHVRAVTVLIDIFTRALEQIGATTEVLGFTTGGWNGGRAYRHWLRQGRPALPGRLNEVCYRVFKPAERTWRQSRAPIAALFKPDLFREGIDGEAVQWAASRLLSQDDARRILVVISDGCPMDTATKLTNDEYYLDNHLKQVLMGLERNRQVDVVGVGVGLDLSPFYRRNVAVDLEQGLSNEAIYDIARLLRPARR